MADAIWNDRYILSNMTSEKLYAKSPLTTGVSGTSAYIGLEPSATYNETVLFSGDMNTKTCTLSESPLNFERVKFYLADDGGHTSWGSTEIKSEDLTACSGTDGQCKAGCAVPWSEGFRIMTVSSTSANSYRNWKSCGYQWWGNGGGQIGTGYLNILEVVGINRKENV